MLDIIVPTPISNIDLMPEAIRSIERSCADLKVRFLVIIDGGIDKDLEGAKMFLASLDSPWKLLHNYPSVGLNQTLREALEEVATKQVLIASPAVRLSDPAWWGKVQVVFHRDPVCGIADAWPNTKSATLHPVKRATNNPASEGCVFAVLQTVFAKKTPPYGEVDPMSFWSRSCMMNGGSSWAVPSIRFTVEPSKQHQMGKVAIGARG